MTRRSVAVAALLAAALVSITVVGCNKDAEQDPKESDAYYNMGVSLVAKGDLIGAIGAYKKAVELNPRDPQGYNNLAITHYRRKDYDSAWKVIRAARGRGLGKGIYPKLIRDLEKKTGRKK